MRWNKSFILHPSMSVSQSKGLERIYLVSVGIEWNFKSFQMHLACSINHLSQCQMTSVQAGLSPFGLDCRSLSSGVGISVEDVLHDQGHSLESHHL